MRSCLRLSVPLRDQVHVAMFNNFDKEWFAEQFGNVKSVALVGNGPTLSERSDGDIIDGHDIVVRMNDFVTDGYERSVGTQTHLYLSHMLHPLAPDLLKNAGVKAILVSRPISRRFAYNVALGTVLEQIQLLRYFPLAFVAEDVFSSLYDELGIPLDDETGRNPSSGIVALQMMVEIETLEMVSLFGFDFYSPTNPIHYFKDAVYEKPEMRALVEHSHNRNRERTLVEDRIVSMNGRVTLHE